MTSRYEAMRDIGIKRGLGRGVEGDIRHDLVQSGNRVRLACAPEWESTTFVHTEHNPWPGVRRLRCPVIALAADRASTFSPTARQRLRAMLPMAQVNALAGTTHFLPMERPGAVRDAVLQTISPKYSRMSP